MFSFEYVLSPDQLYGSLENGSWNGMVGMLVRDVNELSMNYSVNIIISSKIFQLRKSKWWPQI